MRRRRSATTLSVLTAGTLALAAFGQRQNPADPEPDSGREAAPVPGRTTVAALIE